MDGRIRWCVVLCRVRWEPINSILGLWRERGKEVLVVDRETPLDSTEVVGGGYGHSSGFYGGVGGVQGDSTGFYGGGRGGAVDMETP